MSELPRIPPVKWDFSKIQVFERLHEAEIRSLAPGLEMDEVLSYYGIESIDLLPEYDRWFFETTWNRGRIIAKQNAAASLIDAMSSRDALPASLAYLTRFGGPNWQAAEGTGAKVAKGLKIVIEE